MRNNWKQNSKDISVSVKSQCITPPTVKSHRTKSGFKYLDFKEIVDSEMKILLNVKKTWLGEIPNSRRTLWQIGLWIRTISFLRSHLYNLSRAISSSYNLLIPYWGLCLGV